MSPTPRSRVRGWPALLCCALLALTPGCATVVGTLTGAVTGAVDLPRTFYEINKDQVDQNPHWWAPIIIVFAPLGVVTGPVMGLVKGAAIDVQAGLQERYPYGEGFSSYGPHSVWRPWTY